MVTQAELADSVYLYGEDVEWYIANTRVRSQGLRLKVKVRGSFSKNRKWCKHGYLAAEHSNVQNELNWLLDDLKSASNTFSYLKELGFNVNSLSSRRRRASLEFKHQTEGRKLVLESQKSNN